MKKTISLAVATVLALGMLLSTFTYTSAEGAKKFTDVKAGSWSEAPILTAVSKGYVEGYPGGLFKPDANITRAEFMKMVVSALGKQVDTDSGKWYIGYVAAAKQEQLYMTTDFADSDAQWSKEMTRAEMARVAARAIGENTKEDSKWMYLATKKGLITGLGAGKLGEHEKTTRAQSVAIIERILSVNSGKTLPVDKYAVSSAELAWHGTNIFTVMPEVFVDNKVKENVEELWKQENMTITSKDENWKGRLNALIAIDLADPNDPNRKRIKNIDKLKWYNSTSDIKEGFPINKYPNSYLLWFDSEIIYNNDTKNYASFIDYVDYSFRGFSEINISKFRAGELNMGAMVFEKELGDIPMKIVPKTGWGQNSKFYIDLHTPSFSSYYHKSQYLLEISGAKYKWD